MLRLQAYNCIKRFLASGTLGPPLKNEAIKAPQVLFIDENNLRQGIHSPCDLLAKLDRRRYDLVLVNPNHSPPIVRPIARSVTFHRRQAQEEAASRERLRRREKEVRFGCSMAERDVEIRLGKVTELLRKAYRIRMVVEMRGVKADVMGRERMQRVVMGRLRERFGGDLIVMSPPESLSGSIVTVIYCASAKAPQTKPDVEGEG